MMGNSLMLFMY